MWKCEKPFELAAADAGTWGLLRNWKIDICGYFCCHCSGGIHSIIYVQYTYSNVILGNSIDDTDLLNLIDL